MLLKFQIAEPLLKLANHLKKKKRLPYRLEFKVKFSEKPR